MSLRLRSCADHYGGQRFFPGLGLRPGINLACGIESLSRYHSIPFLERDGNAARHSIAWCSVTRSSRAAVILGAALRNCDQAQETHHASDRGKSRTEHQCDRGPFATGESEAERRKRRAGGLPDQARGRHDAARASAATGGALDISAFMFGVWKKPNPHPQIAMRQTMPTTWGLAGSIANSAIPTPSSARPRPPRMPAG